MTPLDFYRSASIQMIDIGSARVAHRIFGNGPDLVCVHGWPLCGAAFRNLLPELSKHFRCHVIDLPGAGDTEWLNSAEISLAGHIRTVRACIEELGLKSYGLLAHDSGAAIARWVAIEDPGRVRAIVMGNTEIPEHRPYQVRLFSPFLQLGLGSTLFRQILKRPWLQRSSFGFGGCYIDKNLLDTEFKEFYVKPLLEEPERLRLQMIYATNLEWSLVDELKSAHSRLQAPVMFIWGENDPWFPLHRAKGMIDQFRHGCELRVIPGRLMSIEEFPEEFLEEALPFLKKHL